MPGIAPPVCPVPYDPRATVTNLEKGNVRNAHTMLQNFQISLDEANAKIYEIEGQFYQQEYMLKMLFVALEKITSYLGEEGEAKKEADVDSLEGTTAPSHPRQMF